MLFCCIFQLSQKLWCEFRFASFPSSVGIPRSDVAGYSRLMAADGEGTLARLKAHRKALIDPKIAEHGGRIIKTTGDGMLVEFASVVDAVRCAVEIQRGMLERNADIPPEKRIDFRVGQARANAEPNQRFFGTSGVRVQRSISIGPLACAVVQEPTDQTRRADIKVNAMRVNLRPDEDGAREIVQRVGRQMFPSSRERSRRVPQPLLHWRIAFPIRDSGQEHQVLALAPSRKEWRSVRKRA